MISVVIAAKNEEGNIRMCLESVKWADEIILVDDVSEDRTVEIAREYTNKIFIRDSKGKFHENKNFGIEKAKYDWILSIDADEVLTPELADEIKEAVKKEEFIGYYINRKNFFLGKWVRHCGWYPNYIIRLFRKGVTRWPSNWPHEPFHGTPDIQQKSKVGRLKNPMLHFSYKSLDQYFKKFNSYTSYLALEEYEKGLRIKKSNFLTLFAIKPLYWFLKRYVVKLGFLDGFRGLFVSFSSGLVVFTTHAKLWEVQNKKEQQKKASSQQIP